MSVEITIGELVLRGVAPEQAHAVAAAVESQLALLATRWTAAGDPPPASRAESSRRLAPVAATAGAPIELGHAVAGAVWTDVSGAGR